MSEGTAALPRKIAYTCNSCGEERLFVVLPDNEMYGDPPFLCPQCERKIPESLVKACGDTFDYALMLRTGEEIRFETASIHGEWVHLTGIQEEDTDRRGGRRSLTNHCFDRGLDVRIADIVWCADAPDGS